MAVNGVPLLGLYGALEDSRIVNMLTGDDEEISRLQQRLVAIERERESGGKRERAGDRSGPQ